MNVDGIMLSENNQTEKNKYYTLLGKVKAFVAVEPGMDNLVEMSSIWSEDDDLRDIRIMLSYVLEELKEKYSPETKIMTLALGPEAEDFIKLICSRLKPVSVSYVKHYYEKI